MLAALDGREKVRRFMHALLVIVACLWSLQAEEEEEEDK
jgi:hypothetical protein